MALTVGRLAKCVGEAGRWRGGAELYQGVGDDEGHPADQEEGTQDDGGHVLEHGVHRGLRLGRSTSQLLLHILRHSSGCSF